MSRCRRAPMPRSAAASRASRSTRAGRRTLWPSFETAAKSAFTRVCDPLWRPPQDEGRCWCGALLVALFFLLATSIAIAGERKFNIGEPATAEMIAGWDIDVRPDGQGLPPGKGGVKGGEQVYVGKCAACHGEFGESAGRWPQVAGGQGTLAADDPIKTVGSYFAHLSTVFDYVRHAMPFGDAQSLTNDELYAVTAYMLFLNDIVD